MVIVNMNAHEIRVHKGDNIWVTKCSFLHHATPVTPNCPNRQYNWLISFTGQLKRITAPVIPDNCGIVWPAQWFFSNTRIHLMNLSKPLKFLCLHCREWWTILNLHPIRIPLTVLNNCIDHLRRTQLISRSVVENPYMVANISPRSGVILRFPWIVRVRSKNFRSREKD